MYSLVVVPTLRSELWIYIVAFFSHWQSYLTGGVVTALITLLERAREKQLSKRVYFYIFVSAFTLAAFFMAWRDQFERSVRAEETLSRAEQTLSMERPQLEDVKRENQKLASDLAARDKTIEQLKTDKKPLVIVGQQADPLKADVARVIKDVKVLQEAIAEARRDRLTGADFDKVEAKQRAAFSSATEYRCRNLEQELKHRVGYDDYVIVIESIISGSGISLQNRVDLDTLYMLVAQL
jgi:hypothetical protein